MTDNEPDNFDTPGTPIGTTGKQLRSAREAKGWDLNSLSESLHLRPAVLAVIENGEYREVPELFLKGYVRSYARLVGLDGDPLIRQLESELQPMRDEEAEQRVESPIFHMEVKKRKKRRIASWVLLAAMAILILFGLIRLQGMEYDFGFGSSGGDETGEPEEASAEGADAAPKNIELVGENRAEDSENGVAAPASSEPAPETAPSPADPRALEEEAVRPDAGSEAFIAGADEPRLEPESIANTEPEVPPVSAAPARQVSFSIEFDGDCWIEVRNGEGERVFAALQSDGDRLSRSAQPPVSFVIGNIDGIESFVFDGEKIEVGGYPSRNGRSQITLGENSGNSRNETSR